MDSNHLECVIVDIDGTIADLRDRDPLDYGSVSYDGVYMPIVRLVNLLFSTGFRVMMFTGRKEYSRADTEKWLKDNFIQFNELHMRPDDDHRPDTVLKSEMYQEHIVDKDHLVLFVLEDRDKMVAKWRELGLTCLQVKEGNY